MKHYLLFFVLLSLFSCKQFGSSLLKEHVPSVVETLTTSDKTPYKVVGIKDGDTFVLLIDGKEQTIRLEHIDSPEKRQSFGKRAKQFASNLCFGKEVFLRKSGVDRYRRIIGEIILQDGINVNKEMVKSGMAWHFKKYSKNNDYTLLEQYARVNKLGIWSESNPVPPWEFRKTRKK